MSLSIANQPLIATPQIDSSNPLPFNRRSTKSLSISRSARSNIIVIRTVRPTNRSIRILGDVVHYVDQFIRTLEQVKPLVPPRGAFYPTPQGSLTLGQVTVQLSEQMSQVRVRLNQKRTGSLRILVDIVERGTTNRTTTNTHLEAGMLCQPGKTTGVLTTDSIGTITPNGIGKEGRIGLADVDVTLGEGITEFVEGDRLVGVGGGDEGVLPPTERIAGLGQTVLGTELVDCVGDFNLTVETGDGELVTITKGSGESRDLIEVHGGGSIISGIHLMFNC